MGSAAITSEGGDDADPTPAHMLHYCSTVVPDMLTTGCDVDADLAHRIGNAILAVQKPSPSSPPATNMY